MKDEVKKHPAHEEAEIHEAKGHAPKPKHDDLAFADQLAARCAVEEHPAMKAAVEGREGWGGLKGALRRVVEEYAARGMPIDWIKVISLLPTIVQMLQKKATWTDLLTAVLALFFPPQPVPMPTPAPPTIAVPGAGA